VDGPGQDYANQRYFNGTLGRFWTPDPTRGSLSDPKSWNKYAYVGGDPINFKDSQGLYPCIAGYSSDGAPDWTDCEDFSTFVGDPSTYVAGLFCMQSPGCIQAMQQMAQAQAAASTAMAAATQAVDLLINDARQSVETLLNDKPECAGAIGASSQNSAYAVAASIEISALSGSVGSQNLGPLTLAPDGSFTPGQAVAVYNPPTPDNPATQGIYLNANVNWSNGTTFACQAGGTGCQTIDLAQGEAGLIGIATMGAAQYLDLIILHEIAHSFGGDHPGTNAVNGQAGYDISIWGNCFK
jgi:RHS repeat-associated protein